MTELVAYGRLHFIFLKSVMPSQVSSTLMTVFLTRSIFRKAWANCCRRMRFYSELVVPVMAFTFRYRIPRHSLSTLATY